MWQNSPPGSLYDYIRVASFSLGPDGRIEQWSERAAELFGITPGQALGRDPQDVFAAPQQGVLFSGDALPGRHLDDRAWTGLVPYQRGERQQGLAEIYVMPSRNERGERSALCVAVDVRALQGIETDIAASEAVFGQSPLGFFFFGTDLRLLRVNESFAQALGRPVAWHRGRTPHDFLPRSEADRLTIALRQVLDSGRPVADLQLVGPVPGRTERRRWSVSLYRLHGGSGRPIGVAAIATDVTGRRRAEREAAGVRRNLALLNEASARIGTSLDLETTARELLDVAVPQFCDLASVDLYQGLLAGDEAPPGLADGSAELRRVAFASAVSGAPVAPDVSDASYASDVSSDKAVQVGEVHRYAFHSPCAGALRTAQPQTVPGASGQSTLAVPMVARDTVVGLVQFTRTRGSEPFGERDTAVAVELASRAAVCIDNARLYRREHERALILQRSLLPPVDPEAAGLEIACRYLPGNAATEVGGDWFDVIELPGHRTALVVGDVMGRGLRAAVAMGELRTAVRTLAMLDMEPAEVLSALDEIAHGLGRPGGKQSASRGVRGSVRPADLSEVYLATCVYAVYDPVTRRCTVANAGHLPPVLVEEGRPARLLEVQPGMPLGVGGELFEETVIELPDGALLALYTDGLVESRDHPLDEGLQAFQDALTDPARPLEDVCDHVLSALDTHHGEDDIALLMARLRGLPPGHVGDWTLPPEPRSVARARELARELLPQWGLEALVDTTELLVSELVTNALRYGEGDIRLRLLLDRTLVCEVWDGGFVQPRRRRARDTDEGGRGLQLVGLLSAAWGSRRIPDGKTVWFELALPDGESAAPDAVEALMSLY
ncbi:SpoIIE family protein phosphatase [Streptomyces sp. AV19]|uniref:SpoIIE family protein phosphatase n=1 Tax=Streptomyces sp. AV19 TaxID=2793068 RepID=UPI002413A303|nr:SpoIIE family protein phosphatase [Streptomyces sp. AV19]MDG4534504.1 SpoIIE family protein phosphatase [Streptomyces sp. AV19]